MRFRLTAYPSPYPAPYPAQPGLAAVSGLARTGRLAACLALLVLAAACKPAGEQQQIAEPEPAASGKASTLDKALGAADDFLPVDRAFELAHSIDGDMLAVVWSIAPDYYLYRHKFNIAAVDSEGQTQPLDDRAQFSPGLGKTDEYFGHVEVYYNQAVARLPLDALQGASELEVRYQGCADAGLCYPVQTRRLSLLAE